ncbi:hypothetical protein C3B58_16960 [Lactonifactor longoviformis]|nr:hypothetical protein C3B58_16960 [Lactonifactor longoviformis]
MKKAKKPCMKNGEAGHLKWEPKRLGRQKRQLKKSKNFLVIFLIIALNVSAAIPVNAAWQKGSNGWWYTNYSSSGYATGWDYINGKWYYFDKDDWMKTGWLSIDNNMYYLKSSGHMATG